MVGDQPGGHEAALEDHPCQPKREFRAAQTLEDMLGCDVDERADRGRDQDLPAVVHRACAPHDEAEHECGLGTFAQAKIELQQLAPGEIVADQPVARARVLALIPARPGVDQLAAGLSAALILNAYGRKRLLRGTTMAVLALGSRELALIEAGVLAGCSPRCLACA